VPAATPAGRVVRVGGGPEGVAVDPASGLAAVATQRPEGVALVDARSGVVRRRVGLPGTARHIQLAKAGGPFLVPLEDADALAAVDPGSGRVVTHPAGDHPHDAAWLDGRIYAGDEFGSTLSELGSAHPRMAPVDAQPGGVAAVGGKLAVISVRAYTVELYDPRTLRGEGSQSAGLGPSHVAVDAGGRLYITDTRGGALTVFATRPRLRWLARVALPGSPYGLAVDARRNRVWVTLTARNQLVEIAAGDRPREIGRRPTVRQANTLAVDPRSGRVLLASRTDGTLELVDP
jgi:DNA-binding beta-propeller fold protein YncE